MDSRSKLENQLSVLQQESLDKLGNAKSPEQIEALRVSIMGKKGQLTEVLKGLKDLSPEDRPKVGKIANEIRDRLGSEIESRANALEAELIEKKCKEEAEDLSLPGRGVRFGSIHPLSQITFRVEEIFSAIGFEIADGPQVETEFYNFEALNIPSDHPARDSQDTFFLENGHVLRTQTSSVQIRVMKQTKPPIRIICPGPVFRSDDDATHSPMFHQVEGLWVDENIKFSDLKGVLAYFAREMFGAKATIRLRPSFFPFTEPSAEVDVSCVFCKSSGCRVCKDTGWIEILGAGLVDPNVFEAVDLDPTKWRGFAFGIGIERIAMLTLGIPDLRYFFQNDIRFLQQF